jgi:hypothetical protein
LIFKHLRLSTTNIITATIDIMANITDTISIMLSSTTRRLITLRLRIFLSLTLMASVLSHGLEPTVLMLALLTKVMVQDLPEFPLTVLVMMASTETMELMLTDMVPLLLSTVTPMVLLELGVHTLMPAPTEMLTMVVNTLPPLIPVVSLLDMDLVLLTTLLQVNMASDTLALMVTILLLSLLVIKAMEPTALGELLLTQVPGPVIGLVLMQPTALLLVMALEPKVSGILLLMLGLVLSTLLLLTVPMTGPLLVLLLSMLPPLPVGPEIMKLQILL